MHIIGIDPSLSSTGVATLNLGDGSHELWTIKTKPGDKDHRLTVIRRELEYILDNSYTVMAVLESLPFNARSGGQTGMAQGVIRQRLDEEHIPTIDIVPSTLKKFATGSGRVPAGAKGKARKEPMLAAYEQATGHRIEDDNQADAYMLALMGCAALHGHDSLHGVSTLMEQIGGTVWGHYIQHLMFTVGTVPPAYPSC